MKKLMLALFVVWFLIISLTQGRIIDAQITTNATLKGLNADMHRINTMLMVKPKAKTPEVPPAGPAVAPEVTITLN